MSIVAQPVRDRVDRDRRGRMRVRYTTTANLVNELAETADEKKLGRTLALYVRVDLLCLDEFGYLHLDKAGAKLRFQAFTNARNDARSPSPRTRRSRSGSGFTGPRLCAAIVDRVTFNAHIVSIGGRLWPSGPVRSDHAGGRPVPEGPPGEAPHPLARLITPDGPTLTTSLE
jgi:hypothetical protein